jgi:hypothetical protein
MLTTKNRRCRLPPEDQNEEQARPSWMTDELLEKTVKVWSKINGRAISDVEALEILVNAGRLMDKIYSLTVQRALGK